MKVTKEVHLAYWVTSAKTDPSFHVFTSPIVNDEHFVHIESKSVEFDVDETRDFTPEVVAALRAQQETIRAESTAALTKLDERINSLLAIECKVTA